MTRRKLVAAVGATAVMVAIKTSGENNFIEGEPNVSNHLSAAGRVNLGSYYTPSIYVKQVANWLHEQGVDEKWTIVDLSCGYGAFFEMTEMPHFADCQFIGNDIDSSAIAKAREMFPNVKFSEKNALENVNRQTFEIAEAAPIVIVGNPPYNDTTSQINQEIKTERPTIDEDIRTRDLGMSSLLAYDKLKADLVAVLHPLSYLIKKTNFSAAGKFFDNYELLNHIVFSSREFAGTSKLAGFPVIVALYRRNVGHGLTYDQVANMTFNTVEGESFSVNGYDYVADHIEKYPHRNRYRPEILFYTLRDVNALKRSRTFINERIANAVDVAPEKLAYYCYLDCFKRYAEIPYWLGNLNVPFIEKEFDEIAGLVEADAKWHNPQIFGEQPALADNEVEKIREYIERSIYRRKTSEPANVKDATVFNHENELKVTLPLTRATGKVRVKARSFFGEYGQPVAVRQTPMGLSHYIEWQIGYDLEAKAENAARTSLTNCTFTNYRNVEKYAYELSEILFYAYQKQLVDLETIRKTYLAIKNVPDRYTFEEMDDMNISRTNPQPVSVNNMEFFKMTVKYPMLVHKFGRYDIYAEVVVREKQHAVGTQAMLYVCLPITTLHFKKNAIGRALDAKETADWIIGKEEAGLALELFRIFGMLSPKHRYDVLAIFEMLFPEINRE